MNGNENVQETEGRCAVRGRHLRRAILCAALVALVALVAPARAAEGADAPAPAALTAERVRELVAEIAPQVEELRGLRFEREVPVRVVDDDAAREYMIERVHAFQSREEILRVQKAYEVLGLVPPGFDLLGTLLEVLREQAGGFYDPESGAFYVLQDIPEVIAPVVVAHELTHALEDQHFDLDAGLRDVHGDDDRLLARGAVHEGSATLLMTVFLSRVMLDGGMDTEALRAFYEDQARQADVLGLLPEVLRRQLLVPYLLGPSFLTRGNPLGPVAAGYPAADVDRAYADPPASTEQILHPEKYWDAAGRDGPRRVGLDGAGSLLGRRWKRAASGVLGELTLGVLVGGSDPGTGPTEGSGAESWTDRAAAGWGGDRWELWLRGDSAVVLLNTVWDTPQDAAEFSEALPRASWPRRREGDRVAVIAGDPGRRAGRVLRRMLTRPVTARRVESP